MQIKLDGQWFQAIDAYGTSRTRVFWPTLKPIDKTGIMTEAFLLGFMLEIKS